MFGCGLPVPHGALVEWAVDALYLPVQNILKCDIEFYLQYLRTGGLKCAKERRSGRWSGVQCRLAAPANGKGTRIESRNMHSREPLRISRLEL